MNREESKKDLQKIHDFTDLIVWKEAHRLVLAVYHNSEKFPKEEIFGLTSQMRRAAISVTSNIAEGFGRKNYKDKIHFYFMSLGSLYELQSQLLIAKDLQYISEPDFDVFKALSNDVQRLLNAFINKSKTFI
ncbi:MAG: hypothetical protein A3H57_04055 [Candidatus Taylorbacteria bacterium RIFCSPLOWO2_02_FULL_43_11]|uniref:Four helix bundle protein n=1 Tax=Candidatus Taylorbacteria bacterium RIFCSPHIGHO2_02_FULL_43_32b TaxID=1802306 RepID=A0A1G2MJ18_9BACT|nr:MAG: hypothetical protein A2743_01515 [Candidatus Taylorbacteria bacterium RIFCSPHIGHO2_01_FULL_43_47]OHA22992.1 MAG: hypothetical protein A3C72_02125 [Candidatus Taylorbacteria bacterium RIFCSPHIGHO2_02_FULL_43_32b]OHA29907.1 MAG: hypothetical protein A3B08_02300 [Candidatus Taylorbacteria bacterium RIFCSPLOWO2_01_FULL_43_44]OHA36178.1 MAG: hypothetical protein A3H57_04055 [Candidatus Taylorbacteria bacterium RIFCSPLOWO2_02_FULL_43_11]